jgi:hypothetical protein
VAEIVRIAVTGNTGPLKWPQRCPRCGTSSDLTYFDGRVSRESVSLGLGYWRFRRESANFPILMCRRHAFSNQLGSWLLRPGIFMMLGRGFLYLSMYSSLVIAFQLVTGRRTVQQLVDTAPPMPFLVYLVMGWVAAGALLWARRVSAVRTVRLDRDQDVAVLRFADDQYAREFKKANPKATSKELTAAPPLFARPSFWKVVLVVGLVAFIVHMTSH